MESRDTPTVLGWLNATAVAVQSTPEGQGILIQHSDTGHILACLLSFANAQIIRQGDECCWFIPHDRQLDDLLIELIDLFISIRYAHPTMVQLEMVLEPDGP